MLIFLQDNWILNKVMTSHSFSAQWVQKSDLSKGSKKAIRKTSSAWILSGASLHLGESQSTYSQELHTHIYYAA